MLRLAAQAPRRGGPLSSNVRPHNIPMPTRRLSLLLQFVLGICLLSTFELGWRVFALTQFLELQTQRAPPSAESVSARLAPFLTSHDAEKIYTAVQSQHVELHQQYELSQGLARSARETSLISLCAALASSLLIGFALRLVRREGTSASNG